MTKRFFPYDDAVAAGSRFPSWAKAEIQSYGAGGGGDASTNTTTSNVNEVAVYSNTTGKQFGRATALNGLAKLTAGVLSTATAGTDYTTPSSTETQTNKTLTAPKFASGGFIADPNGNELIVFTSVGSAVNEIGVTNAVAGSAPTVAARGSDPNIDLNLVAPGTGRVFANADQVATLTAAQLLTNKRIRRRVVTGSSVSATPSINTDITDMFIINGLTVNITSMTSGLTGTPADGDLLWIAFAGTAARTIVWGAKFVDSTTNALPLTTVGTGRTDVGLVYDLINAVWRCMAKS